MRARNIILSLVCGILALGILGLARWPVAIAAPAPAPQPADGQEYYVYLPFVSKAPNACQEIPGVNYISLSVLESERYRYNIPPDRNPDYRLSYLGYVPVNQPRSLFRGGKNDPGTPPQFTTVLGRVPTILNTYLNNGWDWDNHRPIPPDQTVPPPEFPVTVIGVEVTPLEVVGVPDSSYSPGADCGGEGGCDALVIYADRWEISLRYAREDDIYPGYTVHIVGICTEPKLLTLYEQLNAAGRHQLPAVRGGQPIGRAWGTEIAIALRDNGPFLDPRNCESFWIGNCP